MEAAGRRRRAHPDRALPAVAGRRAGPAFADYDELWRWSVDDLEGFWGSVWDHFGLDRHAPSQVGPSSRPLRCPGPGGSPAPRPQLRRARCCAPPAPTAWPLVARSQTRGPGPSSPGRRAARPGGPRRAGLRRLGVAPGRPRRGLPAQHPRDARRLPRHRQPRRGVVVVRRPSSAPAPCSTASPRSSRSCCSPSTATATAPRTSTARDEVGGDPRRAAVAAGDGRRPLPAIDAGRPDRGVGAWDELLAEQPSAADVRRAVPFDHPLYILYLVGHDRPAQAHRPRPRRRPRRAHSRCSPCTTTSAPATASSGSPPRAG